MHVAIAIVGFRNRDDIVRCVGALARLTYPDFEVVICENGGAEAYASLSAALPATLPGGQPVNIVLSPGNLGYPGGVNHCIEHSPDADAWWVLNPDTEPFPAALEGLVARLAIGDCDAAGGVLLHPDDTVQCYGGVWRSWFGRAVSLGYGDPGSHRPDPKAIEKTQNYLHGASMLVTRRFVETAGLMRQDLFIYCEEVEWCLRARRRGLRLGFAPDARVIHHHGTTTGSGESYRQQPRLPLYLGERNKLLLTRQLYPSRLPVVALAALVLLFARYARRGAWKQIGFGLDGWRAGLGGKSGPPPWLA